MLETKSGEFFVGTGPSLSGNHGLGFVLIHTDPWIYDQGHYFFFYFTNYILHVFYMSRHSFRHFFIAVVQYVKSISIGVVLVWY